MSDIPPPPKMASLMAPGTINPVAGMEVLRANYPKYCATQSTAVLGSIISGLGDNSQTEQVKVAFNRITALGRTRLPHAAHAICLFSMYEAIRHGNQAVAPLVGRFLRLLTALEARWVVLPEHTGSHDVLYNHIYGLYAVCRIADEGMRLRDLAQIVEISDPTDAVVIGFKDWMQKSSTVLMRGNHPIFTDMVHIGVHKYLETASQNQQHVLLTVMINVEQWGAHVQIADHMAQFGVQIDYNPQKMPLVDQSAAFTIPSELLQQQAAEQFPLAQQVPQQYQQPEQAPQQPQQQDSQQLTPSKPRTWNLLQPTTNPHQKQLLRAYIEQKNGRKLSDQQVDEFAAQFEAMQHKQATQNQAFPTSTRGPAFAPGLGDPADEPSELDQMAAASAQAMMQGYDSNQQPFAQQQPTNQQAPFQPPPFQPQQNSPFRPILPNPPTEQQQPPADPPQPTTYPQWSQANPPPLELIKEALATYNPLDFPENTPSKPPASTPRPSRKKQKRVTVKEPTPAAEPEPEPESSRRGSTRRRSTQSMQEEGGVQIKYDQSEEEEDGGDSRMQVPDDDPTDGDFMG